MNSNPDFNQLYRRVGRGAVQSMLDFRRSHPPQHLVHAGARWEYICIGAGAEPLLLLHGMAGAYDIWWQVIAALEVRYQIVSLSYPAVHTLEGLRRGVNAVLEAAGVTRFNLVGTSLGGYLAQYLVARQPERVLRAVFAHTFPPNQVLPRRTRGADLLIRLAPQSAIRALIRWNTRLSLFPASGRSELLKAYLDEGSYRSLDKERFLARYRVMIEWFDPPNIELTGIPTLILESANDPLISPQLQALLRETYPTAHVHRFGAVGHFVYLNDPQMYAGSLIQFLSQPISTE